VVSLAIYGGKLTPMEKRERARQENQSSIPRIDGNKLIKIFIMGIVTPDMDAIGISTRVFRRIAEMNNKEGLGIIFRSQYLSKDTQLVEEVEKDNSD